LPRNDIAAKVGPSRLPVNQANVIHRANASKNLADYSVLLGFTRFCSVLFGLGPIWPVSASCRAIALATADQPSSFFPGCMQELKKLAEGLIRLN
jgi:hypothetical protein